MAHIREEILVEAPVEHVWAYFCDASRWPEWTPRVEVSDLSGPLDQVGTTIVQTMRLMGYERKSTESVVEVEPLRLIHSHIDDGPMEMFYRFVPEGDATRVIFESEYEMPGHLPGFIKNLVNKSWVERQTRHMLQDFKALAEVTVPVPA
jgi:uncharacterized membrane protein